MIESFLYNAHVLAPKCVHCTNEGLLHYLC